MKNPTAVQLFEFGAQCAKRLKEADGDLVQAAIASPGHLFWNDLENHFKAKTPAEVAICQQLPEWFALYASVGIVLDPATVVIPRHVKGFDRLIVVPKGMTAQKAYDFCAGTFPCWKYTQHVLDTAVPKNDRNAKNGSYAIWVRDCIEADVLLTNKSADMLRMENITGITLAERLLLELKHFTETGKHLDIENVTLCSGSRHIVGFVPTVSWDDAEIEVGWCGAGSRHGYLRARAVVSL